MGRPRKFKEVEAIERAMLLFWEKGFEAATLPQLLQRMGLTRGSFYKAFKGKRAVYLRALAHYENTVVTPVIQQLCQRDGLSGPRRIRRLFARLGRQLDGPGGRKGCFLCKAAVDRAPHDRDVERSVTVTIVRLQAAFRDALLDDRGKSPLTPQQAKRAGGQLAATYLGLQVLRNAGSDASLVREAIAETLSSYPRR
jgi:TetR/AcrR family transcriptional repressor of nem operon